MAVSSGIAIVSLSNLKLHKNPMIDTGLNKAKVCGVVCAELRFVILLMSFEAVQSYFDG